MPLVDKYDTQSAIELMRQAVDYQGWFDKVFTYSQGGSNAVGRDCPVTA